VLRSSSLKARTNQVSTTRTLKKISGIVLDVAGLQIDPVPSFHICIDTAVGAEPPGSNSAKKEMTMSEYESFDEFEILRNGPEAAILFRVHDSALDEEIWIPRSLLKLEPDQLQVKTWFCRKTGLI
jgi:hypothetical protein